MKEVRDKKANVSILYVEPDATKPRENELTYLERYSLAHEAAGVDIKQVLEKKTQDLTVSDVKEVFPSGADVVFASHSMYFEMDDIWAASNQAPDFDNAKLVGEWVEKHPLTKYLDALANGGVFVVTLGSAQELGTIRSIVLGNHNLSLDSDPLAPKDAKGLGCLKNMQFFAKHLACFKPYYEMHRQCKIEGINKTYSTTTQVPLGRYEVSFNRGTGLYDVHNPTDQAPEHFHAPAVFRYYCGWPIAEEVQAMDESQIASTMKKQEMFLRLLPYFQQGMHLNLRDETMSIRISQ
jgi:hypothetical protein